MYHKKETYNVIFSYDSTTGTILEPKEEAVTLMKIGW